MSTRSAFITAFEAERDQAWAEFADRYLSHFGIEILEAFRPAMKRAFEAGYVEGAIAATSRHASTVARLDDR